MFEPPMKTVWWLPTLGFFLFVVILVQMFPGDKGIPGCNAILEDPGVGRHLRTAEYIVETGQIPRTDPLSYTKAGAPWTDFEWAFETTLGELYRAGGLQLVCAFCYAIFAATVLGIYRTLLHCGFSLMPVVLITALAFLTLHVHFSARPVLFTYLFFALVVEVWNRRTAPELRDWIFLPVVFAAWANLHAGWMGALVFLVLALAGRFIDRAMGSADGHEAPLIPWAGLTALCAAAVSLNPWGWGLYANTFRLASGGVKSAASWIEYQPPNFGAPALSNMSMTAIAVLVLLIVVIVARADRRAPRWHCEAVVPVLFFLWEGLRFQRHVLLLVVIAAVPLARDLESILPRAWPRLAGILDRFQTRQRQAGGDAWLALVSAVVIAWLFVHTPLSKPIQVGSNVSPQLVAFLRDHPDRFQRPFTTTGDAGPLLWAMRPDFRVSIDDRGDFYGDDYVFHFIDTVNGAPGWDENLRKGNFDSLLLDPNWELNELLKHQAEWKEVWRDKRIVIYWRD